MVGGRAPVVLDQPYLIELFQYDAAPVRRRTRRLKPALALSTVLIAENTQLSCLVASQPVRTKQPGPPMILTFDRTPARNGSPDQTINVLHRLDLRLNNTHDRHLTAAGIHQNS